MSARETINQTEDKSMKKVTFIWKLETNSSTEDGHRITHTRCFSSRKKAIEDIATQYRMHKVSDPGNIIKKKNHIMTKSFDDTMIRFSEEVPCRSYMVMTKDVLF